MGSWSSIRTHQAKRGVESIRPFKKEVGNCPVALRWLNYSMNIAGCGIARIFQSWPRRRSSPGPMRHQEHTGQWPNLETGSVTDQPGETWSAINHVLQRGSARLAHFLLTCRSARATSRNAQH